MARGLRRGPVLPAPSSTPWPTTWPASSTPANSAVTPYATSVPSLSFSSRTASLGSSVAFSASSRPTTSPPPSASERSPSTPSCAISSTADQQPILPCFADWIGRLQRCKWLQHFQIFDARYLLDGSRYFSSEAVHCAHCLTTTKNGTTRYHHDILQAAIVHPDKRQVLPLAPEFVRVTPTAATTASRLRNAGYRMLARLRADDPRMAAIIVADSLYSKSRAGPPNASRCWSPTR